MSIEQGFIINRGNEMERISFSNNGTLQSYFEDNLQLERSEKVLVGNSDIVKLLKITEHILDNRTDSVYIMNNLVPARGEFDNDSILDEGYFNDISEINELMTELSSLDDAIEIQYYGYY